MGPLYDTIGRGYANYRKPDHRIAALIRDALGDAKSAINIGAGTGSYEVPGLHVAALEPSREMIVQRSSSLPQAVRAVAEHIPFADKSFDAATAYLTTHHWSDQEKGLREMKRVTRKRCVFFDQDFAKCDFWLINDYFPDMAPKLTALLPIEKARAVFGPLRIVPVPVPNDCTDGFLCAYWQRPDAYLDPGVRAAISFFSSADDVDRRIERLRKDIADGTWTRRYRHLLKEREQDFGYRLIIADVVPKLE